MEAQSTTKVVPFSREGAIIAKARGMFGKDAQLQLGDLRYEKVLTSTSVANKFSFTGDGSTNKRQTEIYLSQTDLAIIYKMRVSLQKRNTTFNGNSANCPDYTYPDKTVFAATAAAPNVSESDALMAIYNGNVSIKAGTIEVLNNLQLSRFYRSNQTQVSASTLAQLNDCGFVDIEIPMIISGQDTTILDFTPAQGADLAAIGGGANEENILAFHFQVVIVRNGAQPTTWTQLQRMLGGTGRLMV